MTQFATEYHQLDNDELLQLWVERGQLTAEAKEALREEVRRRGIANEADVAVDRRAEPPERPLAPPVETFINVSALWWLARELWLRKQTRNGRSVQAAVDSTQRTRHGYRGAAARAELRYSYEYEGVRYTGRAVRDFMFFNVKAADALAFGHTMGDRIVVQVNPRRPERSYYPSGFGWLESLLLGAFGLAVWVLIAAILASPFLKR